MFDQRLNLARLEYVLSGSEKLLQEPPSIPFKTLLFVVLK